MEKENENTEKLSKFMKSVTATGNDALLKRGSQLEIKGKNAQRKLIIDLEDQINQINYTLEDLNDMGPETNDSLRPGNKDWNADNWVQTIQDLKFKKTVLEQNLVIAKETYQEYFGTACNTEIEN